MKEFERFGHLSNYKMNLSKSEMLNISLPEQQVDLLKSAFHFRWQEKAMTYLGVQIPWRPDDLFDLNYVPLLTRTLTGLKTYDRPYFSWFGRINIVKMDILPRFL